MAAELGVSARTVFNWESGRTDPRQSLPRLEDLLGPLYETGAAIARGDLDPDEEFIRQSKTLKPRDKEVLLATLRALRGDDLAEPQHETG